MRGGFIIVAIIFWISVRFELPEQMVRGGECEVSQSGRYLDQEFTTVFAGLLNRGEGQRSTFSILKQKPFYYFATENDTTRLSGFNDESFAALNHIDLSRFFPQRVIHNRESIVYKLTEGHAENERFLFEVHEGEFNYIGAAEIIPAEMDLDPDRERIVHVDNGWMHTYMFYESYSAHWQYIGSVNVFYNDNDYTPDFSLDGFVGLKGWSHGTFQSAVDYTYYRLESGRLVEKFTINSYAYQGLLWMAENVYIATNSETELLQVGASEVFVEHHIKLYSYDPGADTTENTLRSEIVTYSLVEQEDGTFLPNKTNAGFNTSYATETSMNTYFFPEAYANAELNELKTNGNASQKELLKDFVYDSTATFR